MSSNIDSLWSFFWVWICAFCLVPHIIIFIITSVNQKLITLKGLELKPCWNNNANILSIESNYDEFIKGVSNSEKPEKFNVIIKILKTMCDDVKNGKRYNSELYLSMLKTAYDRFFSVMLLLSFFPVLAIIIKTEGFILEYVYYLLLMQLSCTSFILLLNIVVKSKYYKFRELFLRTW